MASEPLTPLSARIARSPSISHFLSRVGLFISAASVFAVAPAKGEITGDLYISTMHGQHSTASADIHRWSWIGFSFTTDGQDYYLDAITAGLTISPFGAVAPPEGRLYRSDANGRPLTLIPDVTFSHSALSEGPHAIFFTPSSTVELLADTTYTFVLMSQHSTSPGEWLLTSSNTVPQSTVPGSSWSISPLLAVSNDDGATWSDGGAGAYVPIAGIYAIPTLAIPEPSTLALLGAVGAAGFLLRRRRKTESDC